MDEYVKTLRLKLATEFNKNEFDSVKSEFNDLQSVKLGLFNEKELSNAKKAFEDFKKKEFEIQKLKQVISEISMFDKDSARLKELKAELSELEDSDDDEKFDAEEKCIPASSRSLLCSSSSTEYPSSIFFLIKLKK